MADPQQQQHGTAGHDDASGHDIVLIVGSGCTGLVLAQGLKKKGIRSIVVEKHAPNPLVHVRDWNMGCQWGAPILRSLIPDSHWEHIESVSVDPSTPTAAEDKLQLFNGKTGDVINRIDGNYFYRLRRSRLRNMLQEGLDIRHEKRLTNLTLDESSNIVTAHFDDGSTIKSRLVVGADGSHSTVRKLLLTHNPKAEPEPRRLPYCATFVQSRYTAEQAKFLSSFHPRFLAVVHPMGFFSFLGMHDAADPKDPSTWLFFFYISWASTLEEQDATKDWTQAQRLAQIKEKATNFADPIKSAAAWVPEGTSVWYMGLTDWDPAAEEHLWQTSPLHGHVTLAGDAAHTMTYQRGQGLSHSVSDDRTLCDQLSTIMGSSSSGPSTFEAQKAAITAYEKEMTERAGGEVRMSTNNTRMMHDWSLLEQSPLMNVGMKGAAKS